MAAASRNRVRAARSTSSESELRGRIADLPVPPRIDTDPRGFDLIAEVKRRSPSLGELSGERILDRARSYAAGGASAVSVLTEPDEFGGSLQDLQRVAHAIGTVAPDPSGSAPPVRRPIPAMRKDFLVDPYQLLEARAYGAGGALLVLRILPDGLLDEMLAAAADAHLFLLVEAFDEEELDRAGTVARKAIASGIDCLVGLNCRNLRTLDVEPDRLQKLAGRFPDGVRRVAESGIDSAADAARVAALGYDCVLVGTALMREADPGPAVAQMLAAGRAGRRPAEQKDAGLPRRGRLEPAPREA
jgi:indole-3-glycerol phosphate synthase